MAAARRRRMRWDERPGARASCHPAAMANEHADLVLLSGRIFTADAAKTWAEAVAVRGNRIVAVGGDASVRALVGPSTRVIDLRGRTVTPGFGDSHVHPTHGGLTRLRCDLHDGEGIEDDQRL